MIQVVVVRCVPRWLSLSLSLYSAYIISITILFSLQEILLGKLIIFNTIFFFITYCTLCFKIQNIKKIKIKNLLLVLDEFCY